jgi:hypothetical protein
MTDPTPGQIAYEAYCRCEYGPYMARADGPLTWGWSLLLDSERAAWDAAAQAVLEHATVRAVAEAAVQAVLREDAP